MRKTCFVFVVGTLKRGFPNFDHNGGEFMADDFVTVEKFPLYIVGERNSPWLINDPGAGEKVSGEIFRVNMDQLAALDAFERVDEPDGYQRERVLVVDEYGMELPVEIYLKPVSQLEGTEVKGGPLEAFSLSQAELYRRRI